MKSFIAPSENFIFTEISEIDLDVSAGSSATLKLLSNNGFADNDFVMVKESGNDQAHICQINATVSGNTDIQVDTLKYDLKKGDKVIKILFNQRKFYGCLTTDGTYTEITADGSPKDIEVDNPNGTLFEYTGSEGYLYFKCTYYNSETTTETDIDDSEAVLGGETDRYCSVYAIRVQTGLVQNPYINDTRINRKRKQAENEINSSLFSRYTLPLSEIPPLVQNICELLASGYIDFEEFGPEGQGVKWLGEGRALLKAIQTGRQRLIGTDDTELATVSTTNSLQGYPDNDGDDDTPERAFTIDKKY